MMSTPPAAPGTAAANACGTMLLWL